MFHFYSLFFYLTHEKENLIGEVLLTPPPKTKMEKKKKQK